VVSLDCATLLGLGHSSAGWSDSSRRPRPLLDRRRSWQRLLLRQELNAAEDVIPDYGSYLFLIPAFECPDELRMLANRFLVRPAALGPARKRPPQ